MPKNITVGLDMLHYAIMDDEDLETYADPVHVPGLITANVAPTTNSTTLYADDKAFDVATSLGDISLAINLADIPTADQAALLGHTVDSKGVLVRASTDNAPYVAVGYRRRMANGKYRYVWLYKGKFRVEEQNATTKTDTPTFQTPTLNATFVPRDADNLWQASVNEGDPSVQEATLDAWFDEVYFTPPAA